MSRNPECGPARLLLAALLLACPILTLQPALAAEKPPAHKTDEITVEGRRIEERLSAELEEYGNQVTVITSDEIEQGGFTEIYQILEAYVPGMFISMKSGPGDYATYNLHGSSELLWLVDGVRINNRLYSTGYLDTISPNIIDRIEVLYGGEGLFYGTEAASGVINIITKSVSKELSGQFKAGYGQYERRNLAGYVSQTIDKNGFMVWGSNDAWNGYQSFSDADLEKAGNPRRETRSYNRTNIGVKYQRDFDIAGKGKLRLHYQRNTNPAEYARINERFALNDRTENLAILKWDHDINKNFSYYIKSYFHDWWTDYTRQTLDGAYLYDAAKWGYQDWGVNAMSSYRFGGGHEILAGLDYQNYFGNDDVLIIKGEHEEVWALFAQYRPYLAFAPNIKPAVGARYNQTGGNDKLIWNVSARGEFPLGIYARGVVGTSFILPNACQLYADEDTYVGNPDLKPEESLNFDFGVGIKRGLFSFEVGYFYQEISDMIALTSTGAQVETYENVGGESEFKGFDLMFGVGPWRGAGLVLSYTDVEATHGDSGEQLDNVPKNIYKARLYWRHDLGNSQIGTDISARFVGDVHAYDTNYGDYWLADWSVFYKFGEKRRHMFTLRAENLFDEQYYSRLGRANDTDGNRFVYGYEGIPLNVMLGYSFTF